MNRNAVTHDLLPGASGERRVAMLQIDLRDLQIHRRLASGTVAVLHQLSGFVLVCRVQAGAFSCERIHTVERASACAPAN
jgi:hypothetical protein